MAVIWLTDPSTKTKTRRGNPPRVHESLSLHHHLAWAAQKISGSWLGSDSS
jgi:hypothetical protein